MFVIVWPSVTGAQRKSNTKKAPTQSKPDELSRLRQEFIKATNDYKTSLEKLLALYERNVTRTEEDYKKSQTLYEQGLISKKQADESAAKVRDARNKVADARQQMSVADTQIANTFLEAEAEKKLARIKLQRGALVRTASYIRFNGGSGWNLSDSWKVQRFYQDTFKRPLPIAVFGQGMIHDQWRLDHRNAMDISLHPDGVEGQALLNFLRSNGIPFLAFRGAIPGTATGPHIHIGRPSHRY
jgi:outer membrane efflux protein